MEKHHCCPRRSFDREKNPDRWGNRDGIPCCTYCGSIEPDHFMDLIKQGNVLGPTDKNYKVYLHRPANEEQAKFQDGLLGMPPDVPREGTYIGKFYFPHLSDEQMKEFVDLLNAKSLKVGYPGHFYRLPFFVEVKK